MEAIDRFCKNREKETGRYGQQNCKKRKYETVLMTFTPISFKVFFFLVLYFSWIASRHSVQFIHTAFPATLDVAGEQTMHHRDYFCKEE